MNRYRAFGLSIASEMILPELILDPDPSGTADLEIQETKAEISEDDALSGGNGTPPDGLSFRLSINGIADFLIEGGDRITFRRADPDVEDANIRLFLLGSCLGSALQQRGCVVLHGNAVTTDGKTCRIVVGHSGAGKSTSAALAYQQGARILADDVCAITLDAEGTPWVHPSYPQLKLWKASADLLGISVEGLRRVHKDEEKYKLPIKDRFWPTPLPLAEVIELSPDHTEESLTRGYDKARCLAEHSYRNEYLREMGLEAVYLRRLMRVVKHVEVRRGMRAVIARAALDDPPGE
jgi:hypothetical protein